MLVGITDDATHAWQRRHFFGRPLRVASSYNDLAAWILATDSTDGGSRIPVGRGSDRTGIDHHDLGFGGAVYGHEATLTQLALDCCAISLSGPTSKIFYVETCHPSIVANLRRAAKGTPSTLNHADAAGRFC